jgi:hypothetical protein
MAPVPSPQPLTSIEAFALALVEASSRLDGTPGATASESPAHASGHDEDGAPAAE